MLAQVLLYRRSFISVDWGNVTKSAQQEAVDVLTPLVDEDAVTEKLKVL